jgi:hypothetical protein
MSSHNFERGKMPFTIASRCNLGLKTELKRGFGFDAVLTTIFSYSPIVDGPKRGHTGTSTDASACGVELNWRISSTANANRKAVDGFIQWKTAIFLCGWIIQWKTIAHDMRWRSREMEPYDARKSRKGQGNVMEMPPAEFQDQTLRPRGEMFVADPDG